MPIFPSNTHQDSVVRSFSRLVVSGGDSPAEHWRVDSGLPILFKYEMGGAGQTDVVIPMGFAVAPTGRTTNDYGTGRQIPVVTIAGSRAGLNPIGIAQYNFVQQVDGQLTGNQPSILTRDYVEFPYFPNADHAKDCNWGSVYGTHANIRPGQYVRAFRFGEDTDTYAGTNIPALAGKLTWWNPAVDAPHEIVGQVLGINDTGSANAWLEWVMWSEADKQTDQPKVATNTVPSLTGRQFDPNYTRGTINTPGYLSQYTTTPQGLLGITDGDKIRTTLFTQREFGVVVAGTPAGIATTLIAPQKNLVIDADFAIFANGTRLTYNALTDTYVGDPAGVTAPRVSAKVEPQKGHVTITTLGTGNIPADIALTMTYRAKQYGTPGYWNFAGAVGGVRILLKF